MATNQALNSDDMKIVTNAFCIISNNPELQNEAGQLLGAIPNQVDKNSEAYKNLVAFMAKQNNMGELIAEKAVGLILKSDGSLDYKVVGEWTLGAIW